ncbi:MAG TPA: MerR family transcriptional regulator [Pseudonocardiaceae bacterium]|jgi:DNA-binding transcriptional MerR regulator|nr:MerR family transcriptional regulator [Pseudonocardiaceae bacterium]
MHNDGPWTIDQLSAVVAEALVVDYPGPPSGRIREVPDRRTIRWYTTIGLLDRPAAMRGRTALYDRRHVLQLVAIKRLQADGHTLAEVQRQLVGATDTTLTRMARLPDTVPNGQPNEQPETVPRERFWAAAPNPDTVPPAATMPAATDPPVDRALVHGVRLGDGVTLLLADATRAPDAADLSAIEHAAAHLLAVLRDRGLDGRRDCS